MTEHPAGIFRFFKLLRESILIGIAPDGRSLEFSRFPSSSHMTGYLPVSMGKDGNSVEKQRFFTGKPRK